MSKNQVKLAAILLIVAAGLILAIMVSVEPVGPPCAEVAKVFVDLDADGDEDLLTRGCVIYNNIEPPPTPIIEATASGE